jgi:hypothetical protein
MEKKKIEQLQELAIWMTGCGYDFTDHQYFLDNRHLLGSPVKSDSIHNVIEIGDQVQILNETLESLMTSFDSEDERMDFIMDICNGYRVRLELQNSSR